jgi:hypothetical protein
LLVDVNNVGGSSVNCSEAGCVCSNVKLKCGGTVTTGWYGAVYGDCVDCVEGARITLIQNEDDDWIVTCYVNYDDYTVMAWT